MDGSTLRRYMRHGTLRQLGAFVAVVRLGSVTVAAQRLHMAQPTLSGLLRKLSESLDVTLFEQRGRRLAPTPAALVLLQACDEAFAAFDRCERLLADLRGGAAPVTPTPAGLPPSTPAVAAAGAHTSPPRTALEAAPAP